MDYKTPPYELGDSTVLYATRDTTEVVQEIEETNRK